tara:strand:+ start:1629 stop:2102 length:474 start_codon:yes stop_codon:yes gene_type:complete
MSDFTNKPFFIPQKEVDLFDAFNEELIDEIVGQSVDVYKVSVENTNNNVYGESTAKYYEAGFRVNCLLLYNEPETIQDEFGSDLTSNIEVYFHRTTLKEAGFFPEIGDIIDWNDSYYEVGSVTEPQLIGGHQGFRHQIKVNAFRSRLSSLHIERVGE